MAGHWRCAAAVLLLAAVAPGCRTLNADPGDWTREEALSALRGYHPEIQEVGDHFISVPDPSERGAPPLIISFSDIDSVRVVPEGKWFVLWIFTAAIYGPLCYDLEVTLMNGRTVPIIRHCRWGLGFIPFWIYPNVLIHGYGPGFALDWLRQDALLNGVENPR